MKTCNGCKICTDKNMAQIPYIEHQRRMHKAYQRENALKVFLVGSNILWVIGAVITYIAR